jgi:signal transduction histidine kinase
LRNTFQARARTIDHLGRGQIADCPTAVSELWKNAYDAYAKNVALHIFDGDITVAAVTDDGTGMSKEDFLERWLVIGTEAKLEEPSQASIPKGMDERPRQGEKGIGRLSAAFLAPVTLVLSKKKDEPFVAVMLDWRYFENPYLSLDDIEIAVETFDDPDDLFQLLPTMIATVQRNVRSIVEADNHAENEIEQQRQNRVRRAWERFSEIETFQGVSKTTLARIADSKLESALSKRHLEVWPVFMGEHHSGTALFLLDAHRELAVLVDTLAPQDDEEITSVKEMLRRTLTGFTDPLVETRIAFNYGVFIHKGSFQSTFLQTNDVFSLKEFRSLEHTVEGEFDEFGTFRGRVHVFGRDRGEFVHNPKRPLPSSQRELLGPFRFCVGTFEQDLKKTTHGEAVHSAFAQQAEKYSGVYVYRDSLRVMPYGNPSVDLFHIEEQRSKSAGRYFWSHRRGFGRAAFTRLRNPNLRDKAGREGLVDNRASREMRILVEDLLKVTALRFFGSASDIREQELDEIKRQNIARISAEKARKGRRTTLRKFLKANSSSLESSSRDAQVLKEGLTFAASSKDRGAVARIAADLEILRTRQEAFRLPPVPSKLGDLEEAYRAFRDAYRALSASVETIQKQLALLIEEVGSEPPEEVAKRQLQSNSARLSSKIETYKKALDTKLNSIRERWQLQIEEDHKLYFARATPKLEDLARGTGLSRLLNLLDADYSELEAMFTSRYEPMVRTLDQLLEDIDLEGALAVTESDRVQFERQAADFNTLAQLGIAVEIVGHELETMDQEVRRNLGRLPSEVQQTDAFKLAMDAHRALSDRLRFLAPLRLAGYRSRETITGSEIATYIGKFFERRFQNERVNFVATDAFRSIRFTDLRSRILPVFINLVNNALHWIQFSDVREIRLDCVENLVVVADSGPGIDEDDVPRLFELFFTRRTNGRGVGLHLARLNLAVAHHEIRYAKTEDPHVLLGANFIIEFRGMSRA